MVAIKKEITRRWQLYLMLLPAVAYIIIFKYIPMYGITLAFKSFSLRDSLFGGSWVGLKYFNQFFDSPMLLMLIKNTLMITFYSLLVGFPFPILFALALNEIRSKAVAKTMQTITYAPYFISTVVMVGIILQVLHLRVGMVNNLISLLGFTRIDFMGKVGYFRHIYVWSGLWQGMGFAAVIYIAALAGVDPELVEASVIDGVTRIQKIWHINLPSIAPTIVIQLIFAVGGIMSLGFDKIWLMQNSVVMPVSEVISTFVYKRGLEQSQYSYATAVDLVNAAVNVTLLVTANFAARRIGETSLW
ncbi:MAG: ABC transporter permease subunit [Clostridiales bacterium]|jgi:multiple sugar transport system permease protein/putative aldouronate transport system permease protein|nr:ABC transporter permease subunit [Clostridiales bacterium]